MITVWHNPNFTETFYPEHLSQYNKPIDFATLVAAAEVDTDSLDVAYHQTQNLNESWTENADVKPLTMFPRSTSVGDVLTKDTVDYVVAHCGFITLEQYRAEYQKGQA